MNRYRIVLRGRLSERFESAFEGMALEPGAHQTVLVGDVRDQAHLYGLLDRLRDFGIELVAVEQANTCDISSEPSLPASSGQIELSEDGSPGSGGLDSDPHGD